MCVKSEIPQRFFLYMWPSLYNIALCFSNQENIVFVWEQLVEKNCPSTVLTRLQSLDPTATIAESIKYMGKQYANIR